MKDKLFNHDFAHKGRLSLFLSRPYVADYLGITDKQLQQIELGIVEPTTQFIESLSVVYGIPAERFYESTKTEVENF